MVMFYKTVYKSNYSGFVCFCHHFLYKLNILFKNIIWANRGKYAENRF